MFHLISRPFGMLHLYVNALFQYAHFDGRSSRKEFRVFFGINIFFFVLLSELARQPDYAFGQKAPMQFALAVLVPSLATGVRRMHDCGKKGWYFFIPVYNLILAFSKGENKINESDPKS